LILPIYWSEDTQFRPIIVSYWL